MYFDESLTADSIHSLPAVWIVCLCIKHNGYSPFLPNNTKTGKSETKKKLRDIPLRNISEFFTSGVGNLVDDAADRDGGEFFQGDDLVQDVALRAVGDVVLCVRAYSAAGINLKVGTIGFGEEDLLFLHETCSL